MEKTSTGFEALPAAQRSNQLGAQLELHVGEEIQLQILVVKQFQLVHLVVEDVQLVHLVGEDVLVQLVLLLPVGEEVQPGYLGVGQVQGRAGVLYHGSLLAGPHLVLLGVRLTISINVQTA